MGMDERFTVNIGSMSRADSYDAEIAIVVSYKPWFCHPQERFFASWVTNCQRGPLLALLASR
jgi:hypothetical protein